jgi:predicted glycogen debranching enzyme
LLLATQRFAEAKSVLGVFAEYVSQGMIPNRFNDYTNEAEYNTVDASLWFIHACFEYRNASKDSQTFEKILLPACRKIIEGYSAGTRYGIAEDKADGLITQGDATTQLTWMDAKTGDHAFTPRQGKPVEINALWYNALVLLGMKDRAARVQKSFVNTFWIDEQRGLRDVAGNDDAALKLRPNQIFAVSLPNSPLSTPQQKVVVEVVRRELLTPYGLRTLATSDPMFQPIYRGDQFHRDRAYHNGTIWPWLIGPFIDAYLRIGGDKKQAIAWLQPLLNALDTEGCLGQLAEIYEAAEPHRPVGCYAQAWSVAEVLRLAVLLGL